MSKWKIDDLLHERHRGFSPLQKLLRQAGNQDNWTNQLRALLPGHLAKDCRVTEVRGTVIVVVCGNAGTATRLRFMAPDLVDQLRTLADFRTVETLQIKVSSG
jgi:hypothetical protein